MIVQAVCGKPLVIGIGGEQQVTAVTFDISGWIAEYGSGSAQLLHRRARDTVATPVAVTQSGGTVTWTITESDTAYPGTGEAQLIFIPTGKTKKSAVFTTLVDRALNSPYNVPEPMEGWVDQVTETAAAAELWATGGTQGTPTGTNNAKYYAEQAGAEREAAQTAQGAAEDAQTAAETAQGKAEDAQEAAETAQAAAETAEDNAALWATGGSSGTPTSTNNAKHFAGEAEEAAEAAEDAQEAAETAQGKAETAQGKAEDAQEAAETAQGLAETAQGLAEAAQTAAETAEDNAALWATGGTTGTPGAVNNAKYYAEQAAASALIFITDKTLSTSGRPADAAVTGERIRGVEELAGSEADVSAAVLAGMTDGKYIAYNQNGTRLSQEDAAASDYVDISGFDFLKITTRMVTSSWGAGLAFYRSQAATAESFISGVRVKTNQTQEGFELRTLEIPEGANYFRTTWYASDGTYADWYGNFSCTLVKIGSLQEELDEKLDASDIDATLTESGKAADAEATGAALAQKLTAADIDDSLSTAGKAADAKATGDALALKLTASDIDAALATSGKAADAKVVGDILQPGETAGTIPSTGWQNYTIAYATGLRGSSNSARLASIVTNSQDSPFDTRSGITTDALRVEVEIDSDTDSPTYGERLDYQFYAYGYDDTTEPPTYLGGWRTNKFEKKSMSGYEQQTLDLAALKTAGASRICVVLLHKTSTSEAITAADAAHLLIYRKTSVVDTLRRETAAATETDKTLTVPDKAADAKTVGDWIDDREIVTGADKSLYIESPWTTGRGIRTGAEASDYYIHIRPNKFSYVPRDTVRIQAGEGYYFYLMGYDENDECIGYYNASSWSTSWVDYRWRTSIDPRPLYETVSYIRMNVCKGTGTARTDVAGTYSVEDLEEIDTDVITDAENPAIVYVKESDAWKDAEARREKHDRIGLGAVMLGSPQICICDNPGDANYNTGSVEEDVYPAWDALCTAYPDWIRRVDSDEEPFGLSSHEEGEDPIPLRHYQLCNQHPMASTRSDMAQSGTNNIWDQIYSLRRVMLTGGVHGGERDGVWAPYNFCAELLSSDKAWAQWIRCNVLLDIVPVLNPWGYNHFPEQQELDYPGRLNADGININRDYLTQESPEAQAICGYIESLNGDVWASFDCHTTHVSPYHGWGAGYVATPQWNPALDIVMRQSNQVFAACWQDWEPIVSRYPVSRDGAASQYITTAFRPYMFGSPSDNDGTQCDFMVTKGITPYAVTVETPEVRDTSHPENQGPFCKLIMDTLGNLIQMFASMPFRLGVD